jgi:hypothetical protein
MNFVPPQRRVSMRRALVVSAIAWPLPWPLRRWLLRVFCGYSFGPGARVGHSLIGCPQLCTVRRQPKTLPRRVRA